MKLIQILTTFKVLRTRVHVHVRTSMYSCFSGEIVLFDHTFTFRNSVPLMVYIFTTYSKVKKRKWGVHYLLTLCNVQNETRHTDPWPKQCTRYHLKGVFPVSNYSNVTILFISDVNKEFKFFSFVESISLNKASASSVYCL